MKTPTETIAIRIDEVSANARKLGEWVKKNPWINSTKVYLTLPLVPMIEFSAESKAAVVDALGADGWHINSSDRFEKKVDGISIVIIRGSAGKHGTAIPESEMLEEAR